MYTARRTIVLAYDTRTTHSSTVAELKLESNNQIATNKNAKQK